MTGTTFFGRAMRSFAALAFVLLAQPALATFNCEIVPTGPTSTSIERGGVVNLPFDVIGLGCGTSVTTDVSIVSNTTGTPSLPAAETAGPGPRSPAVQVGSNVGTLVVRVLCTAGCFGSPANLTIDYTIDATPVRTLDPIGSTSFTEEVGASGTISVRAQDDGSPAGTVVVFNTTGPVSVSPTSVNTDPGGVATVTATFGTATGPATITAERIDAPGVTVTYNVNVVAVQPRAMFKISGDDQTGQTGSTLSQPLVVEVRDSGATTTGVGINWSVVSGDATLVSPTSPSDATGRAQTGVLFGPTDGTVVVRATRADDPAVFVEFNLFSFITRDLTIVSGNNQVGLPNTVAPQPLVIEVTNNGVPTPGIVVDWAVFSGLGSATLIAPQTTTDASGRAQSGLQFGPNPGAVIIGVQRLDNGDISRQFTATIVTLLRTVAPISGNGQTGEVGTPLPNPLVIEARDNGVAAPGIGITWSVVSGDATLVAPTSPTDAAGRAQTGLQFGPTPGPVVVRATRADDATATYDFTVTSAVVTRTMVPVSGNGQTAATGSPIASPLVIEARNNGVATPGVGITWSVVSGDATLVAPTSPTDAAGRAQTGVLFGATPGAVVVRATRADNGAVTTDFTVTSTLTRTMALVSGNGQTAATGSPIASPLVVETRNNGVAAPGIGITWSVVSGDATLVAPTSPTDAAGRAQTGVLFGATPGAVVVRAARADDATVTTDFTVTSTLTRTMALVSGNGQAAATGSPIASPLVVETRNNGVAAPGIGITWSIVSGSATLVAPTSPTDAAGRAQTGVLFGATPGAVVVRAARADDATVTADFTLTSTFTRTITLISGGNQLGLPGLPLPNPIILEVRGNGQPEAGVSVNIEVEGDATLSGDGDIGAKLVRVTDGSGRVSAVVTLGPTSSGAVNVQVSVPASPGVSTTVTAAANSLANVPGLTEPQREVGDVIQLACAAIVQLPTASRTAEQADLLARCQSLVGADPAQVADALDEMLPDTSLAMVNVALQAGQAQLDNLKARIAALRSGTRGQSFGGLALASPVGIVPVASLLGPSLNADEAPEVGADFDRWGYFVSGTIGRGEAEPGQRTPAYDFDINGLTAGLDYRFNDGFVGGASVGYTRQDTDLEGGEGKVEADGFSLSAYATFYRDQSWYTDAVLSWGRNDYDTQRRIRYTLTGPGGSTTIDQTARGQLNGDSLSLASTVGRDYQAGTWNIGPYGRLLYSRIDFDAGREVIVGGGAGSGLALEIVPGAHTSVASVIGTKFSTALSRDWGILMPHFQVEWEHEYRDDPQRVGARFLADPNATRFSVEGDPIDSSFFRIGAGLSVLFAGGRSGFVYVERVVGKSGFSQTNVALGIRGEF